MSKFRDALAASRPLLIDGAMGTELFSRGLESGNSPEAWNVDEPDRVRSVYQAYVDAGSDIFLTNTFGGTHFRLKLHDLHERVIELNAAGARLGREVADAAMAADPGRTVLVAGSMGPTGELLEPMGSMTMATCADAFAEQAAGLLEGGADVLWIETMSSLDEVRAAVEGARRADGDVAIVTTMSFDTAGRSMMGVTGTQLAELGLELGVDAVGANCGNNLPDTEAALLQMRAAAPELSLVFKGNAGMPEWHGSELHYSGTPDLMGAYADRCRDHGIDLIGACCGSSPAHIHTMRQVLDGSIPVPEVTIEAAEERPSAEAGGRRRGNRRRRS